MTDIYDRLASYGVRFEGEQGGYIPTEETMTLNELAARKGKVVRLRFIGGEYIPGKGRCYDISYAHGVLPDGTRVSIQNTAPKWSWIPRRELKKAMIDWAKEEGVFAKGLGMLDDGVYSILG